MSNPIRIPKKITKLPAAPRLPADEEVFPPSSDVLPEAPQQPPSTPAPPESAPSTPTIGRNTVSAVSEAVTLQWANGKTIYRATMGAGRFVPLIGFHIEVGKDAELDAAMVAAGVLQVEIKHQRQGGAEIVTHWDLGERLSIYPVTSGPVAPTVAGSLTGRNAHATIAAGLGLRWGQNERSKMAVRGYLDLLVRVGYVRLVQLAVRSRMTDVLLSALVQHARACEAADHLIDRAKHPEVVTYHELALPLGPGEEQEWGKGDTASVVPFVALHPIEMNADYLRGIWRPEGVHWAAQEDWESIQYWAVEYATETDEEPSYNATEDGGK